ncbi:putative metallo-beta-lactamase, ribonuclease Z/Hydroxyacylglutathione hydrolase [Septoria linicola]|nr:putative metallo-beta-lactamase, ribonuclease Z/Hydroxyacylglutathione hydrolase [Septoria linicola]
MAAKYTLQLDPSKTLAPTRDNAEFPASIPQAKATQTHPSKAGDENASIYFIGTATTLLEWEGIRILTDPNFLHAGDHVHLGPGVQGTRRTNPAVDLHELPHVDVILLSHYHADHFDQKVEASLRRDLPIITTPHAKEHLHEKKSEDEKFTHVYDLDHFESAVLNLSPSESQQKKKTPAIKVSGMPGKHVPPGPLSTVNDLLGAVPPTNGWMVELGYKETSDDASFKNGYRIYISGDTLMVDELKEIPERYKGQDIDLMLIHLGGTTIPSPSVPLLMVTMDAKQGVQLMQLIKPDITIPIHFDDYDVFLSPLEDFKKAVMGTGFEDRVVYLDRADEYRFKVQDS